MAIPVEGAHYVWGSEGILCGGLDDFLDVLGTTDADDGEIPHSLLFYYAPVLFKHILTDAKPIKCILNVYIQD